MNCSAYFKRLGAASLILCAIFTSGQMQAAELRIAYPYDIVSEDPADYRHRWTEVLLRNAFDSLLTRDPEMRLVPELAESWVQVAPTMYEFRLRRGVRFQDGRPMTAKDVVYSFERLIKPGALNGRDSPRKGLLGPLEKITAVDPLTVRFELASLWPIFPAMLPFQQVVARPAQTEQQGFGSGEGPPVQIGSGPFRLAVRFPGDAIIFERNVEYFGGAADIPPVGPACVDRVVVNIIPGNESRVAGLLAGEFDIAVDVRSHSVPVIADHPNADVQIVDGTRSFFLAMTTGLPPFDDARVRRAMSHALDRERIVDEQLGGRAVLIDGILGPNMFGKNRNLPRHEYDPELSRALLEEAGYPDGITLELDVTQPLFPIAEAISVQLAAVGIRAQTVVAKNADINQKWRGLQNSDGARIWLRSWGGAAMDPVGIFDATHHTNGRGNAGGFSDPRLDNLLDAAGAELNENRREALYQEAEALINEALPYVYLWVPQEIYGLSSRVSGFAASPDGRLNLQDVCVAASP